MSSGAFGCCCILVAAVGFVAYMFTTDTMAVDPIYWLKENDLQEYTAYFQSHGVTMEEVILYEKSDIEAISSTAGVGNTKNMKFRSLDLVDNKMEYYNVNCLSNLILHCWCLLY
eukprot:426093_1